MTAVGYSEYNIRYLGNVNNYSIVDMHASFNSFLHG